MAQPVTILGAFLAGVLSFLSPCILPLVPAYLSYLSGRSVADLASGQQGSRPLQIVLNTLCFVCGLSAVFIMLGAVAPAAGSFLQAHIALFGKIAGALIIILGLHLMGALRWLPFLNFLYVQKRVQVRTGGASFGLSFLLGLAFAFGWSPCVGPILAAVLAVASVQETMGRGVILLAAYSAGIGVPFILISLAADLFIRYLGKLKKAVRVVEIVSGVLLIIVGALIFTNQLMAVSGWFNVLPDSWLNRM